MSDKILIMYKTVTETVMATPVQNTTIYLEGPWKASKICEYLLICPNVKQTPEHRARVVSQGIRMRGMASVHLAQDMDKWEALINMVRKSSIAATNAQHTYIKKLKFSYIKIYNNCSYMFWFRLKPSSGSS